MSDINEVRERLKCDAEDFTERGLAIPTANDIRALLADHARLAEELRKVSVAPAIDLEQFRVAVEAYEFEGECKRLEYCFGPDADKRAAEAQMANAKRLMAMIDGQMAAPRGPDQPDLCDLCRVREEVRSDAEGIPFCQECWDGWQSEEAKQQPTKGEGE